MSHLETSNADSAQSKDVWNENLEFLRSSADCLISADCLQNPNEPIRDYYLRYLVGGHKTTNISIHNRFRNASITTDITANTTMHT